MSFESIVTGSGVTVEQFERNAMSEYLRNQFWMKFSGTSDAAPIQMKSELTKTAGDAITFNLRSQLKGGVTTGAQKAEGNEGKIEFYAQRVVVDNDDVSAKMENVPIVEQRVHFSAIQSMRDAVVEKRELRTDDRITNALSSVTTGRVQGRYLYGAADSNWDTTHATALTAVDDTDDQLTTDIGDIAKRKAQIPINATAKIRPMRVRNGSEMGVQEWFLFVNHTFAIAKMVKNDARWRQPMLLVPPLANPNLPIFTGSSFKGAFNGVLYYEWEGIELISSTIQVGHGLFLGAQACAFTWAQFGKFNMDAWNYGKDQGLNHHEINGVDKMIFDRNTVDSSISNEDHGTVHTFVSAVGD